MIANQLTHKSCSVLRMRLAHRFDVCRITNGAQNEIRDNENVQNSCSRSKNCN